MYLPGEGTKGNPYIIEGLNITGSTGILLLIEDTTVYFRIQNNIINGVTGASDGIYLSNVTNGLIKNNIVTNCKVGIQLSSAEHLIITGNTVSYCLFTGISLHDH